MFILELENGRKNKSKTPVGGASGGGKEKAVAVDGRCDNGGRMAQWREWLAWGGGGWRQPPLEAGARASAIGQIPIVECEEYAPPGGQFKNVRRVCDLH